MGKIRMVDVGEKEVTERVSVGFGMISLKRETVEAIRASKLPKGDVLTTARIAGIMGAKRVPEIVPLCHNIPLHVVDLKLNLKPRGIEALSFVKTSYHTGAEIEALTAVNTALITAYDMVKSMDPGAAIKSARVIYKSGGKSGAVHMPAMKGRVFSLAAGEKKTRGGIKTRKERVECDSGGIVGDGHYRHEWQVSILSLCELSYMDSDMVKAIEAGFNNRYVNLVVTGLDSTGIDSGDRIVFSKGVEMKVKAFGKEGGKCRRGWEGAGAMHSIYADVVKGGIIEVGESIELYKDLPFQWGRK